MAFSAREPEEILSVFSALEVRSIRVMRLTYVLNKISFHLVFGSLDLSNLPPYGIKFPFAFCNADSGGNLSRLKSLRYTHNTQERRVVFPSSC